MPFALFGGQPAIRGHIVNSFRQFRRVVRSCFILERDHEGHQLAPLLRGGPDFTLQRLNTHSGTLASRQARKPVVDQSHSSRWMRHLGRPKHRHLRGAQPARSTVEKSVVVHRPLNIPGQPPDWVLEFNEGEFEQAAQSADARLGAASPHTLNQMLAEYGFGG